VKPKILMAIALFQYVGEGKVEDADGDSPTLKSW
jgi:hypothetical protein